MVADCSAVQDQLKRFAADPSFYEVHLLQSWVMDLLFLGALPPAKATAVRYRISCEMYSRSKLPVTPLLQSWVMDLWSPGVT